MKRVTIAVIGFTALAFPTVLLAAVFSFGCCVMPCHSMLSPTVPMCGAAPTPTVVHIGPPQEALPNAPAFDPVFAPGPPLVHNAEAVDRDVGLFILLATLII